MDILNVNCDLCQPRQQSPSRPSERLFVAPLERTNNSQSGMTLVELMIALVISSIVVFFLFSIQSRMSGAYRGQGTVSEINQNLQAARQMLVSDIRMAGFGLAAGTGTVDVAPGVDATLLWSGFTVQNDVVGDGNDSFRLVFADSSEEIFVSSFGPALANYTTPDGSTPSIPLGTPIIVATQNAACLVAVTGINATEIAFDSTAAGAPYNPGAPTAQCANVATAIGSGETATIQRVISRSYRIDPSRPEDGYLQMSPSGQVTASDWVDMGVGFTNLQIATRYFEPGNAVDSDGDGDPERDWYSSDNQTSPDPTAVRPANAVLVQVSLSIEGRGAFGTRGASASLTTPAFIDLANINNNPIGDWGQACTGAATDPCGIHLSATPDASRPDRYKGESIYRYTQSTVDLRNLGIGQ